MAFPAVSVVSLRCLATGEPISFSLFDCLLLGTIASHEIDRKSTETPYSFAIRTLITLSSVMLYSRTSSARVLPRFSSLSDQKKIATLELWWMLSCH